MKIAYDSKPLCGCSCGLEVNWNKEKKRYNLYLLHHHSKVANPFKGKKHTAESIEKQRKAKLGKTLTDSHKRKIGESSKGRKHYPETKEKIRQACLNHDYSEERIIKATETCKANALKRIGSKWPEEVKKKQSESNKGKHNHNGEQNPNWKDGVSFLPYPPKWTKQLRIEIIERDENKCQNPNCPNKGARLSVHHIDYVKENCSKLNLITLCIICNSKANRNRQFWKTLYSEIVRLKYD